MKKIDTKKAPAAIGPYSQAFEINGVVYTSGQLPVNPADNSMPETIEEQTKQSCENVKAVLEEAGISLDNVFKTTCFYQICLTLQHLMKFMQNILYLNLREVVLLSKNYQKALCVKLK